jgi:cytochrome c-type biogenesis protein CcmH/NrfG/uncharacterized coiled-coil protein SlyX
MMKAVLKTLAISFGGGLALGAGLRLTQGPAKTRPEPRLDLDPLLARLRSVETRIVEMESGAPVIATSASPVVPEKTLAAFESRLAARLVDVEQLRGEVRRVDQRLGDLDSQIPIIIQSTVNVRFGEVERKLQQDFEQAQSRSMAAFVETLQTKVVERISTLETNLAEQSQAIGKLRDASVRSDENLQKMLIGIERLVDQTKAPQPPPPAATLPATPVRALAQQPSVAEPVAAHADAPATPPAVPAYAGLPQQHEQAAHHVEEIERAGERPPSLVSEASIAYEVSPDVLAPARVAETPYARAMETAPANGAVCESAVVQPDAQVAESPAADSTAVDQPLEPVEPPLKSEESYEWVNRIGLELLAPRPKPRIGWRIPLAVGLAAGLILIAGLFYSGVLQRYFDSRVPQQASALASTAPASESAPAQKAADLQTVGQRTASKPGDPASLVELGHEYQRRKDWAKAETSYRSALEASPGNRDAALGLSDVLYQQQKYEESAAVLNKLSASKSQ